MNGKTILTGVALGCLLVWAMLWVAARQRTSVGYEPPDGAVRVRQAAPAVATKPVLASFGWDSDYEIACKVAQSAHKPMMIDFFTDWCGACKVLDEYAFSDAQVKSLATSFECVRVDGDARRDLASTYHVTRYPTVIFLNGSLGEVRRVTGCMDGAQFVPVMQEALKASGCR